MIPKFLLSALLVACLCCYASASTRIVGGQTASNGQFPYIVSLRNNNNHFCGGSIISPRTVVTAAHCNIYPISTTTVVVGTNTLNGGGLAHKVSKFKNHENYNTNDYSNDIAVIITASTITWTSTVKAIALPSADNIGGNNALVASGWGYTSYPGSSPNNLQFLNTKSITLQDCANKIGGSVVSTKICTLTVKGQGICSGDSGGPLVSGNSLVGVSSTAYLCALGKPDFFTRVFSFKSWINSNTVN